MSVRDSTRTRKRVERGIYKRDSRYQIAVCEDGRVTFKTARTLTEARAIRGDVLASGAIARPVDGDVEAVFGQAQHAGAADVAARAGDQRGPPGFCHQITPPALSAAIALLS
jgi:hypothetical protein